MAKGKIRIQEAGIVRKKPIFYKKPIALPAPLPLRKKNNLKYIDINIYKIFQI